MSIVRQNGMNHWLRIWRLVQGSRRAGDARRLRRIAHRDDRLGDEAVIGFRDLVFLRLRLIDVAEGALVHEGEMRVVERVLHHPQRRSSSTGRRTGGCGGSAGSRSSGTSGMSLQRLAEADPDIAVTRLGRETTSRARRGPACSNGNCGIVHQLAVAVVFPAVIAADDVAVLDPALGELRGAMAAAVLQRRRLAVAVEEQHDLLAEQGERLGTVLEIFEALVAYQ